MNLKNITEQEIFELLSLEKELAWSKLLRKGIVKPYSKENPCENRLIIESLADCAFRLREEIGPRFYTAMSMLYDKLTDSTNPDSFTTWWMFSHPIHWIVAAMLAMKRAEK